MRMDALTPSPSRTLTPGPSPSALGEGRTSAWLAAICDRSCATAFPLSQCAGGVPNQWVADQRVKVRLEGRLHG